MKRLSIAVGTLALVGALAITPASAQSSATGSSLFDLRPQFTQEEFDTFTADVGSMLRFRQLGDSATLAKGRVDVSFEYSSISFDHSRTFPQVSARFGVGDRVDIGTWGGVNFDSKYGVAGFDTKIAVLRQSHGQPVSVSIRPSFASLIGPSNVWVSTAGLDLSVSRAFGALSPYAGVAASGSLGIERSAALNLDPATVDESLVYAGLSYGWRTLIVAAEVQKGNAVSYGFRVGTRF